MNLAYIISAYKNPNQLVRLVERLSNDRASFFIHVDKRSSPDVHASIASGLSRFPNVWILEPHRCHWGDFGHVRATLKGIREIYRSNVSFDYVTLLTGQDYPIKSSQEIDQFLSEQGGRSFLEYFPLPNREWEGEGIDRIETWHFRLFNRHLSLGRLPIKRPFPRGFDPYGGSSYWCLSSACIHYIWETVHERRDVVRFFRHVDVPDEMFFQTLLLSSPLRYSIINDNLRHIEWRDAASGSPAILGTCDFERLATSAKLFARKFDESYDARILDLIDCRLLGWDGERSREVVSALKK